MAPYHRITLTWVTLRPTGSHWVTFLPQAELAGAAGKGRLANRYFAELAKAQVACEE
jgi:hypothetical protein